MEKTTLDKLQPANTTQEQEYVILEVKDIKSKKEIRTYKDKIKDFFVYNGVYIVLLVAFAIIVPIMARSVIAQKKPDITVIVLSSKNGITDYIDKLQNVFEKSIDDVNGDGQRVVNIVMLPVNHETKEIAMAAQTRLFTEISAGNNLIFISDEDADKVINTALLFKNLERFYPVNTNMTKYKFKLKETNLPEMLGWDNMSDDLYIAVSSYDEGMAVTKEKCQKQYEIAKAEFNKFIIYIT